MVDAVPSPGERSRRPSLARTLTLALVGLVVVLAVIATAGLGSIYKARQSYEDSLARAYSLESASSSLYAASVVEQAAVQSRSRAVEGPARGAYESRARRAAILARDDPPSARLVRAAVASERAARRLASARSAARVRVRRRAFSGGRSTLDAVVRRQAVRRAGARDRARDRTRSAALRAAAAGLLAVLGAVALVAFLTSSIRRPLAELVTATRRLADGDLSQRVDPSGPRELVELDGAFNEMADGLEEAHARIESERMKLATTIESLGDALVVTDAEDTVTAVNPRARELVPALDVGKDAHGPGSPLPEIERALAGDVSAELDGRDLSITAGRLPALLEGGGVVWTIRDVSERARLERMKTDFVATASHELRSPLTSIKGFVELLGRSEVLGDREREFVDVVLQSTDRLVELVNDLLDVARLEAGRMEIHARLFDVHEVIEEVARLLRPRVEEKDQRLVLDIPPGLPKVLADPLRVRQVMTNLISNAHQYSDEGATITVTADGDRDEVELSVADDGRGMSPDDMERVFERFVRRDDALGGTGLGLSIVHSLVEIQNGTVDVASTVGEGTVFTVRLPAEGAGSEASRRAVAGRRVLVATPRAGFGRSVLGQLEARAAAGAVVESPAEAIRRMRDDRYQALVVDAEGFGEEGLALVDELRADPDLGRSPLAVICTREQDTRLAGEWRLRAETDADTLAGTLGAAILAERSSILVVGRSSVRDQMESELLRVGLDHEWVTSGTAAAQACRARRFEVALVDAGMRAPNEAVSALDLRGRRHAQAVIMFTERPPAPGEAVAAVPGTSSTVPIEQAGEAVLEALARTPDASFPTETG
jgi:signal transduction histidine kinase/DNA-binding response OmpR family regulator/HAMP domain-containing protein